ncbi:hypothetical protein L1987_06142 [Smallanthus sonchifolius]|uniref:Uncharacterized protein n=1 Tax=Smallanthus sonchifolius TaxID=185202 RepID=A0ACB9JXP2_9ASTR|nr:hypothetical protein L1987_06142 [Smallanthus sonchifolius]
MGTKSRNLGIGGVRRRGTSSLSETADCFFKTPLSLDCVYCEDKFVGEDELAREDDPGGDGDDKLFLGVGGAGETEGEDVERWLWVAPAGRSPECILGWKLKNYVDEIGNLR